MTNTSEAILVVNGEEYVKGIFGPLRTARPAGVLRVGDEAYGVPIAQAIEQSSGKRVILASVYNTLERLEEKGLIRSTIGRVNA